MKPTLRIALGITVSAIAITPPSFAQNAPPPWDTDGPSASQQQHATETANPFTLSTPSSTPEQNTGPSVPTSNPAQNTVQTQQNTQKNNPQTARPANEKGGLQTGGVNTIPGNSQKKSAGGAPNTSAPPIQPSTMGMPLGLEQKAWDNPIQNKGPGQSVPGTKPVRWRPGLITPLNLRQDMITTIQFPEDTMITSNPILSDPSGFEAQVTNNGRSVTLRPIQIGIDANVQISDDDGNTYIFYLRSQPWNYKNIPDVYVPVSILTTKEGGGGGTGSWGGGSSGSGARSGADGDYGYDAAANTDGYDGSAGNDAPIRKKSYTDSPHYDNDSSARLSDRPRALGTRPGVDYAAHANTGNGRIRSDITISIPRPEDAVIAPIGAWRDDKFMYLDFGPRASTMLQWPVAKIVVDGVESPVQTQVTGPDRSIIIVKAIGNIVLRNRSHIVCLKIPMASGDPRSPTMEEVYQNTRTRNQKGIDVYDPNAPIPLGATPAGTGDYIDPRAAYTGAPKKSKTTPQSTTTPVVSTNTIPTTAETSTAPTWPGNGSQKYHISSGPYDMGVATLLATEIGQGYRGNNPASAVATVVPASQVSTQKYGQLSGPVSWVNITAGSPVLAKQICDTLKTYNHTCTLY